jgi:hypothetical protein
MGRTKSGALDERRVLVAAPNFCEIGRETIDTPLLAKSRKAPRETFTGIRGVWTPVTLRVEVPEHHTRGRERFPTAEIQSHRDFFSLSPQN